MKLTEVAKIDFEKWYKEIHLHTPFLNEEEKNKTIKDFHQRKESEKFGVYVNFFDSVDIYISVSGLVLSKTFISDVSINENIEYYFEGFKNRPEARIKAIEKANEIYNNL